MKAIAALTELSQDESLPYAGRVWDTLRNEHVLPKAETAGEQVVNVLELAHSLLAVADVLLDDVATLQGISREQALRDYAIKAHREP